MPLQSYYLISHIDFSLVALMVLSHYSHSPNISRPPQPTISWSLQPYYLKTPIALLSPTPIAYHFMAPIALLSHGPHSLPFHGPYSPTISRLQQPTISWSLQPCCLCVHIALLSHCPHSPSALVPLQPHCFSVLNPSTSISLSPQVFYLCAYSPTVSQILCTNPMYPEALIILCPTKHNSLVIIIGYRNASKGIHSRPVYHLSKQTGSSLAF